MRSVLFGAVAAALCLALPAAAADLGVGVADFPARLASAVSDSETDVVLGDANCDLGTTPSCLIEYGSVDIRVSAKDPGTTGIQEVSVTAGVLAESYLVVEALEYVFRTLLPDLKPIEARRSGIRAISNLTLTSGRPFTDPIHGLAVESFGNRTKIHFTIFPMPG